MDITRLSHIVCAHIKTGEAEPSSTPYTDAQAMSGDVRLANADAELVFQENTDVPGAPCASTEQPLVSFHSLSARHCASALPLEFSLSIKWMVQCIDIYIYSIFPNASGLC